MEKELDGVKYILIPIPPYASPYTVLIGNLLRKKTETVQEAETVSAEIQKAMDKLFTVTVKPKPRVDHETQLFNELNELTKKVIDEADFFHKDKGPDAEKSEPDGGPPASEA
jgi:hypothetical protein